MTAPTVILHGPQSADHAARIIRHAPFGSVVEIHPPRRSLVQNARLHALITEVARQVEWAGSKRTVDAWKDIFTAALRSANHGLDVVPGLNGGFVLLGMHTSGMTKQECTELMDLIEAWGAENGVTFHDPSQSREAAPVSADA